MFGDPTEIRTPATAVKGRCLSHLTIGPLAADARVELANERVKAVCVYHFTNPQYKRWFFALPQISMPCYYRFSLRHTGARPSTLLLYVGCILIPKNMLGTLFFLIAPALKGTSEYGFLLVGINRIELLTPALSAPCSTY